MTTGAGHQATILDVAKLAGVSRTTVSRVLNEPDRVTPETLDRVRDAAKELNYAPSVMARSLRGGRTDTVALIVGDISQPFHGALAQAVAAEAEALSMSVVLHDLARRTERLERVLENLPRQAVDAAVIAMADPIGSQRLDDAMRGLQHAGIPLVTTLGGPSSDALIRVTSSHQKAGRMATETLARNGARRIVLMVGHRDSVHARQLEDGYIETLHKAMPGMEAVVLDGAYDFDLARDEFAASLARDAPDALVVATTPMALGAIRAAVEAGRRIPEQLSVVSCEEVPLAVQVNPSITTAAVSTAEIGAEVLRLVQEALRSGDVESRDLEPILRSRASTRVGPT